MRQKNKTNIKERKNQHRHTKKVIVNRHFDQHESKY